MIIAVAPQGGTGQNSAYKFALRRFYLLAGDWAAPMSAWIVHPAAAGAIETLQRELGIPPLKARLLVLRGIESPEQAAAFMSPSPEALHDPFLFNEMSLAVRSVREAIAGGGKILVHGDYDADGICGTAILYSGLRKLGANVHFFVPDRIRDGYGLSERVVERCLEVGISLLISVDCGSSDEGIVRRLSRQGVPVVITDHHEIGGRITEAQAVLNPKLPGEAYPFKELAGAGVAFKLMQGLQRDIGVDIGVDGLLDLAAVGTLGDYVSLTGENRTLVTLGLRRLGAWERTGLEALRRASGLSARDLSARRICYTLVPRLNSPGRIGSAREVVELLTTSDGGRAGEIAARIEETNRLRKAHDGQVTDEARYLADETLRRGEPNAFVFSSPNWHEGVVGIGAARLAETYNLPTVLIAERDGIGKGSVRSAGGLNVREALERCSRYLSVFGGHREAGGFSIAAGHIPAFNRLFNAVAGEMIGAESGRTLHYADGEIGLRDCTLDLARFIERLEPLGPGNLEPIFLVRGLRVGDKTRFVGKGHRRSENTSRENARRDIPGGDHLRLAVEDAQGIKRELIGFALGRIWHPADLCGATVDVLAHVRRNSWQGREEAQVQVTVIRRCEEPAVVEDG